MVMKKDAEKVDFYGISICANFGRLDLFIMLILMKTEDFFENPLTIFSTYAKIVYVLISIRANIMH